MLSIDEVIVALKNTHGVEKEWLEELKALRTWKNDVMEDFCKVDCSSVDEVYQRGQRRGYNKAIDDFVEKISLEISESIIYGMLVDSRKYNGFNDTSDKIVDYVIETSKEIAEQLKTGESE